MSATSATKDAASARRVMYAFPGSYTQFDDRHGPADGARTPVVVDLKCKQDNDTKPKSRFSHSTLPPHRLRVS